MNVDNLFDYVSDITDTKEETYYFISEKEKICNSLITLAISKNDNKIYKFCCEWLYLINKIYYPNCYFYIFHYKFCLKNCYKMLQ